MKTAQESFVEQPENSEALQLSPDQEQAVLRVRTWLSDEAGGQLFTLAGVGGSGKTTVTGVLARGWQDEGRSVLYAAPTGKAAQVLTRNLQRFGVNQTASTIHGLIYKPIVETKTGRVLGWEPRDVQAALLVLDEASMISREVIAEVLSRRIPVLAIGDHRQLPPVGESSSLMSNPIIRLERIHRQAAGNPIIRLATAARNGAPPKALRALAQDINDPRIVVGSLSEAIEFGKPPGFLVCYTNKTRTQLTRYAREAFLDVDPGEPPRRGEPVICLRNQKPEGIFIANGMRGIIQSDVRASADHFTADVLFDAPLGLVPSLRMSRWQFERVQTFTGFDEIPNGDSFASSWGQAGGLFDYAYAITAHKAQGDSAENVAVAIEQWSLDRMEPEDRSRWLYTAFSRASERLMLYFR
jgi:exodeoxyribonuclease-5